MCSIGYGSNKKTRHMMPNGLRRLVVSNTRDVDLLLMHNNTFAAEIAANVSSKKRIAILEK
ncbi:ribosomal protein L32e [Microstroma glucosiphilum]|uniref:Ribosomal protein L32e n=1 Tax=Pseudomicrostroma glucosiphilum TaxID=1684307 RepID=A0A316U8F4_9BASI|nr:ribosomal protein L32e [Pseudomicrostroma glucosiphilum]PWN20653.1 ribosomal protein L32e [Pseudomicrostroma glucosiphilum]